MQTHSDSKRRPQFDFRRLEQRAKKAEASHLSTMAAGRGEQPLSHWSHRGVYVCKRPDDEQGILRISIGGGVESVDLDYCVFRGDRFSCARLLRRALKALESKSRSTE